MLVVSCHDASGHAKSCKFMYVDVCLCAAREEEQPPALLDLEVSFYSICGIATCSAEAAISSSVMDFSLMILTVTLKMAVLEAALSSSMI